MRLFRPVWILSKTKQTNKQTRKTANEENQTFKFLLCITCQQKLNVDFKFNNPFTH